VRAIALGLLLIAPALPDEEAKPKRNTLIELYTSQG
jgi:hypothetical protein